MADARVVFKRGAPGPEWAPWEDLKPCEWIPAPEFYAAAGWAFAVCPNGHAGTLTSKHKLAVDRQLNPSYICPQCSFHAWVVLDG